MPENKGGKSLVFYKGFPLPYAGGLTHRGNEVEKAESVLRICGEKQYRQGGELLPLHPACIAYTALLRAGIYLGAHQV